MVEGRYDKNTLSQIADAPIIETSGFGVFNDREKLSLLRRLADKRGLIILTDSDGAGFQIRNYLRGSIDPAKVKHAYIPDVKGKERRKRSPSGEGKLGVEGMGAEVILDALKRAGATIEDSLPADAPDTEKITKADLFELGLSGGEGSAAKRTELLAKLGLPSKLSSNAMLDVLNCIMTRGELFSFSLLNKDRADGGDEY